jgi:uncharacterized protein YggE
METQIQSKFDRTFKLSIIALLTVFAGISGYFVYWYSTPSKTDYIYVTGSYTSEVKNQIASLNLTVRSRNSSKETSSSIHNERVSKVLDTLKTMGIDEKDIRTSNYNSYREILYYTENEIGKQKEGDWITTQSIDVQIVEEKMPSINEIISRIQSQEVEVLGPTFTINDNFDASEIYKLAFEDAKKRAKVLVEASGRSLGKATNISEIDNYSDNPEPMGFGGAVKASSEAMQSPNVPSGSSKITKSLSVTFEVK